MGLRIAKSGLRITSPKNSFRLNVQIHSQKVKHNCHILWPLNKSVHINVREKLFTISGIGHMHSTQN